MDAYELANVSKNYATDRGVVQALREVTLSIGQGEWVAVQGRTGFGKSTLLNLLGGLDRPTSGTVTFQGRDLGQLREADLTRLRAESIGYVFQTFNLVPTLSASDNVEAALIPLRPGAEARRRLTKSALDAVGLADRAHHLPGQLSGGQQQRVAIARALVKTPSVLLADEPTGNLDEDTRDDIIDLLKSLWRERSLTWILVTHDRRVAAQAGRVITMNHGWLSVRPASAAGHQGQ